MSTPATISVTSPYVGPRAFNEADRGIFFGRESEGRRLAALVIAHRAVLLYAQSGAGKTSLLQASLVPGLQRHKRISSLPIGRVGGEARGDVPNIYVYNTLRSIYSEEARPAELAGLTLAEGLAPLLVREDDGSRPHPHLLLLDQFEEMFTTHAGRYAERSAFFTQLQECLQAYPALSLLLSMREDYIAHLDAYSGQMPDRLRTRFRLERLGREAALLAVKNPLQSTGRQYAPGVAEALVDNLRSVQQRVLTESGSDMVRVHGPYVEPVHLQIVCRQLWDNLPPERDVIELDDVQQFGDVDQALIQFYEEALQVALPLAGMGQRRLRRWFDTKLITPAQTRGLLFRGDRETEGLPNLALDVLVNSYVVRADIRGGETWVELSHDRLVEPILQANSTWREAHANPLAAAMEAWQQSGESAALLAQGTRLAELEAYAEAHVDDITAGERHYLDKSRHQANRRAREAAQRNQRRVIIGSSVIGLVLLALSIWALINADRASDARATALANEQAAIMARQEADGLRTTAEAGATEQASLRAIADEEAATAVVAQRDAIEAQATAIAAREESEQLRVSIQASQLAAASQVALEDESELTPGLALRLATAGLGLSQQPDTEASFFDALFAPLQPSLLFHAGPVIQAYFSADGQRFLTVAEDDKARLWERDGTLLVTLEAHEASLWTADLNANGQHVLTTGCEEINDNGTCIASAARLWDDDGNELHALGGPAQHPWTAVFSPYGERIVTADVDGTARVWDLDGTELAMLAGHRQWIYSVAFSPDGDRLVTTSLDGTARLWNLNGTELAVLDGHNAFVWAAAFSYDGREIVTAGDDGTARIWDSEGSELAVLEEPSATVSMAAFSPSGSRVVTLGCDEVSIGDRCRNATARLWEPSGTMVALLKGPSETITSVAFSPDGQRIATAGCDAMGEFFCELGAVYLWDLEGNRLDVFLENGQGINAVQFSPDGGLLITAGGYSIVSLARLWDPDGPASAVLRTRMNKVSAAAFSPDGQQIVTGGCELDERGSCVEGMPSVAELWNTAGNQIAELEGHAGAISAAAFSPDGRFIATASDDRTARLWNLDGTQLALLDRHTEEVNNIIFSPDGERILTISDDDTARLWNLEGTELALLEGHAGSVNAAAFSPSGRRIVTGSSDNTARVWDTATGQELSALSGHESGINTVAFSPDGRRIATGSADGIVRLWDLDGTELAVMETRSGTLHEVAFSPDGQTIVTVGFVGVAQLWNLDGTEQAVFTEHGSAIASAQFSPDGRRILTASWDDTARLWDLDGTELAVLKGHTDSLNAATFSPDGELIMTASSDGTVRLWLSYLSLESKVKVARQRLTHGFSDEECQRFFRDDPGSCPQTLEELFALFDNES